MRMIRIARKEKTNWKRRDYQCVDDGTRGRKEGTKRQH